MPPIDRSAIRPCWLGLYVWIKRLEKSINWLGIWNSFPFQRIMKQGYSAIHCMTLGIGFLDGDQPDRTRPTLGLGMAKDNVTLVQCCSTFRFVSIVFPNTIS